MQASARGSAWSRTPAAPGAAKTRRFLAHCFGRAVRRRPPATLSCCVEGSSPTLTVSEVLDVGALADDQQPCGVGGHRAETFRHTGRGR